MLDPGTMVDHFEVMRLIGRGGMGEVYLARDTHLGRKVALKVINPDRLGSPESLERFLFEARTTAQFSHPHIVTVFAAGAHQGSPYIALEYLEGQTLRQRMREEWPGLRESLRIGLAIAEALKEAHQHSVQHRDLKPENVMFPRDGRLRVVDFGLAKQIADDVASAQDLSAIAPASIMQETFSSDDAHGEQDTQDAGLAQDTMPDGDFQLDTLPPEIAAAEARAEREKQAEAVVGTPTYMSPEQWLGMPTTGAADVWALGVLLFELVSGRRPYKAASPAAIALKVVAPEPAPPIEEFAEAPTDLSKLIASCLLKNADERPAAAAVAEALDQMISRRRLRPAGEQSPFRGLLPFGERHADFFFGRDAEIAAFLERMREEPVLPVVGPSGAGKSSFIQAGVITRLREQGPWTVLQMRPGGQPFLTLAARLISGENTTRGGTGTSSRTVEMRPALQRALRAPDHTVVGEQGEERALAQQLAESPPLLSLMLQRLAEESGGRVLLFVDQLEELYTLVESETLRQRFMQAVCTAADDPQGPARVIFTLRDDFLGRLAVGAEVREALSRVTVIRSPSPDVLEEIIVRPLESVGYRFDDPSLAQEMVASVRGEPACLPLLQFATQTLWERRDKSNQLLRRSAYDQMGGVAGALAEHADGVLEGLSAEQVRLARELLLRFVTSEGTRRVLPRSQALEGLGAGADEVLDRLTRARLLSVRKARRDEADAALELVHESLIRTWTKLARWLDESRDEISFLTEIGQAAELWQRRGRKAEEMWRGEALRDALRARQRCAAPVPELVDHFLEAGRRFERRAVRRRRLAVMLLAVVAVTAAALAVAFFQQRGEARRQGAQIKLQWAEAQREGARAAFMRGDLLEARAKLRGSLETQDSSYGRALWWWLSREPLRWKKALETLVYDVTFSPDGRTVAVACQDKTIQLFDVETMAVRVLRGHADQVLALAFSPDGARLASGTPSGEIRIWEVAQGAAKVLKGHDGAVWGLAFSPDGARLASASWDKSVRLWEVESGLQLRVLSGHADYVWGLDFSRDGQLLASASSDQTVRVWDLEAKGSKPLKVLAGHTGAVSAVSFDARGRRVVSASYDATVRVWDLSTGAQRQVLRGHADRVRDVRFSPDGERIFSASSDNTIRVWDIESKRTIQVLRGHTGAILSLSVSPNGRRLVSGGNDKSVRVWEVGVTATEEQEEGHTAGVWSVAFDPTGGRVASGGHDNTVRLWELKSGLQQRVLRGHGDMVFDIAFSPDGKLLASVSYDKSVRIWDLESGVARRVLEGHAAVARGVAFSPDGLLVASGGYDKTIRLWDVASGREERVIKTPGWVTGVAFSPDGELLAASETDQVIRLWEVATGASKGVLEGHTGDVLSVAFSPDGARLVSGGADGGVRVWKLRKKQGRLVGEHGGRVYHVAFGPDGKRVASASADGTARLWPLAGGEPTLLRGHASEVNGVAFSPNGQRVITSGDDGTVRLWSAESGQPSWHSPLLRSSPPRLLTHRGWRDLDTDGEVTPKASKWRRAVEQRARAAAETARPGMLCLQTFDDAVELWDLKGDRRLFRTSVDGLRRVVAMDEGCAALSSRKVQLFDRSGKIHELPMEASALTWDRGELLVAAGRQVYVVGPAAEPRTTYDADLGVTSLLRTDTWLVLGFAEGNIELVPLDKTRARPAFSFEAVPSSPVAQLIEGPMGTLVVGYENGLVGLWNFENGTRLHRARLHGPVRHLLLRDAKLYAATELGGALVLDLSVFRTGYCELVRSVWERVSVIWEGGLPMLSPPDKEHRCARAPTSAAR